MPIDERPLSWEDAMKRFVDTTGRAGPATGNSAIIRAARKTFLSRASAGTKRWRTRGFETREVPTGFHWTKAALPDLDIASSFAASILPLSNFGSAGPARAASHQGLGPHGTYDMFGNARECDLEPRGQPVVG